jgi:DNA topoisomerase-6 subunit B
MYVRRRQKVKQEGERRSIFLRYLGEVATAVSGINEAERQALYEQLLKVAKKKTATADMKLDDRGQVIEAENEDFGDNVLIVDPATDPALKAPADPAGGDAPTSAEGTTKKPLRKKRSPKKDA